ncbi:MAG: ferredoxin [Marmoricola sp.]
MSRRAEARLHVDWTRCDGHGTCADLLPDLMTRDDWGFPILESNAQIPSGARDRAALAVDACPMLALRIVSGG